MLENAAQQNNAFIRKSNEIKLFLQKKNQYGHNLYVLAGAEGTSGCSLYLPLLRVQSLSSNNVSLRNVRQESAAYKNF